MKKVHPNLLNSTKAIVIVFVTVFIVQEVQEVHQRRTVHVHHCTAKECYKTKNLFSNFFTRCLFVLFYFIFFLEVVIDKDLWFLCCNKCTSALVLS